MKMSGLANGIGVAAIAAGCLFAAPAAQAGIFNFNVVFNDGGTGMGTIDIDQYGFLTGTPTATTTPGTMTPPAPYTELAGGTYNAATDPSPTFDAGGPNPNEITFYLGGYGHQLFLEFMNPIAGDSGSNPAIGGEECLSYTCPNDPNAVPIRLVVSGAITPAPEPISIAVLGSGLVGLGAARFRRRH